MALPKVIRETKPIRIPSLNREVDFEPYTTRDEKILIMMDENTTHYQKAKSQCIVLSNCCVDKSIDFESLPLTEVVYLFLQLRRFSVGSNIELTTTCKNCNAEVKININIADLEFEEEKLKPLMIPIDTAEGPYLVVCEQLSTKDLECIADPNNPEFEDVGLYIKSLVQADGNGKIELTIEERKELFGELDIKQTEQIIKYASNTPQLAKHIQLECSECGQTIEGELNDFFI